MTTKSDPATHIKIKSVIATSGSDSGSTGDLLGKLEGGSSTCTEGELVGANEVGGVVVGAAVGLPEVVGARVVSKSDKTEGQIFELPIHRLGAALFFTQSCTKQTVLLLAVLPFQTTTAFNSPFSLS